MRGLVQSTFQETAQLHEKFASEYAASVENAGAAMSKAINSGHKIIWLGNGGSATQAQHMAAEFVGRFQLERRSLPSISLTENIASVTAIGNDYGYDQIFSRQLEGLSQSGDVVVGLSTSGNSPNVVKALEKAQLIGLTCVGLTGETGGKIAALCDICICVPSKVTARIQEVHLTIGHTLCALVEEALS